MSRLVLLFAILDDIFLFVAPAVVAFILWALGLVPLWLAAVVAAPFLAFAAYVGFKVVKERPRQWIRERGVAVEDLRPEGMAKIGGVYWRALSIDGVIQAGSCVELVEVREGKAVVRRC